MKYFVISDTHGFYSETVKALEEKGFFKEDNKKLILCGDLLDRGNEALKLVDLFLELKRKGELIYITGNHEDLFIQALQEISRGGIFEIASGMSHHYLNGTWDTLLQLAEMSASEAVNYPQELVRGVMKSSFYQELLPSVTDYYETEGYVFCHGWIPSVIKGSYPDLKYRYNPNWRCAPLEKWKRARWFNGMELSQRHGVKESGKTVVCGHWHASYGHSVLEKRGSEFGENADFTPFIADGIIAIDACTAESGRVNCIVLTDNGIE